MTTQSGWGKLPTELRLKIYHSSWEPRTVFLGNPQMPEHFNCMVHHPVTLHLNYEARAETLKHYTQIDFFYRLWPGQVVTRFLIRYINPSLDVLFVDGLADADQTRLKIKPSTAPRSLHVAVGRHITPSKATRIFTESDTMNYVASIDFWFTSNGDIPLSPRTPEQLSMLPITSRYRLCRTANAVKTPIVTFEDTLWCPEEERGKFQCPEPGCRNPTSVWRWGHVRGANRPIVSCPSHSLDANALPIPGSEVRIPCVVAHWTRLDAREILHREKALIFDIGVPDRGWALLEVRPPNVWRNIVLQWAENYLETAGPLSEFVEYIDVSHLSPGDHSVFGAQVLPIIVELFYRSGSSIISGKVVEGVCLPEYQLGEAIAAMPCTNDYPLVSDILEDEVLEDHSGEDNPEEDAMSDETYYFPDIMATWNIVNGFNRWHSCD